METRRIILDKCFVQGTPTPLMHELCHSRRALMPDVLFYEMITCEEPDRSACFAKFPPIDNPVVVVPNVGNLLRSEIEHRRPCGRPSDHALTIRYRFHPKLANGTYAFSASAQTALKEARAAANEDLWRFIDMINVAPLVFPEVFKKGLRDEARRAVRDDAIEEIVNDPALVRTALAQLKGPIEGLQNCDLGLNWLHFRWLQVKLAATLDLAMRYGQIQLPLTPKRTHEFGNFMMDLQYVMLALLEGGLASRDAWLMGLFRRLCPSCNCVPAESMTWKTTW